MSKNIRLFKYSFFDNVNLEHNFCFATSRSYALHHYSSRSIVTFIPKNACTSLRASLAIANGFIPSLQYVDWIHDNNITLTASLFELQTALNTLVILRCPFQRISSAYLDKFGTLQPNSFSYFEHLGLVNQNLFEFTFLDFLRSLKNSNENLFFDPHWFPQTSFLLYESYDHYLNFNNFTEIINSFSSVCGFDFVDASMVTNNRISGLNIVDGNFSEAPLCEIISLRSKGLTPGHFNMFNKEAIALVSDIYSNDLDIFIKHFGKDSLLFK